MSQPKKVLVFVAVDYTKFDRLAAALQAKGFEAVAIPCHSGSDYKKCLGHLDQHGSEYVAAVTTHVANFVTGQRRYPESYPNVPGMMRAIQRHIPKVVMLENTDISEPALEDEKDIMQNARAVDRSFADAAERVANKVAELTATTSHVRRRMNSPRSRNFLY